MYRAGLTIWWALRTPKRRGPTGKLDAEDRGWGGVSLSPPLPTRGIWGALYKLPSGVRGGAPSAENGFGKILA